MLNKVEISGINTSDLKTLKSKEATELLKRVKQGDHEAREKLIKGNLRLVLSVIQKFSGRGERTDDLFQVGCIGLMKAIDNFDISQPVRFSTYGVPMIAGEIRRFLRDNSSVRVSRSMRDTAYKALQEKERLTALRQKEPKLSEIAKNLDIPLSEVYFALDAVTQPVSIYEPVFSEGGESLCVMDQISDSYNTDESWIDRLSLSDAFLSLGKREKRILTMRFLKGKTQMEVASEIGVSQAQVSRLEKNAIKQIKNSISDE